MMLFLIWYYLRKNERDGKVKLSKTWKWESEGGVLFERPEKQQIIERSEEKRVYSTLSAFGTFRRRKYGKHKID
jgi:hypothetical protein